MDQTKESFNERESLQTIHEMINKAKRDIGGQAFYPILWGWVVLVGSIGHYVLLEYTSFQNPWMAWLVVFVGIIGSAIKGYRSSKKESHTNYSSSVIALIWVIFLVSYFTLLPFMKIINYQITPIILLMTAGSLFLSGFVIKFKPFYFGGVFVWIMAIVAFLYPGPLQLLICGIAALFGILIPGYILKNKAN